MPLRFAILLALLAFSLSGFAQTPRRIDARSVGNQVIVNEVVVLTVLSPKAVAAQEKRAAAIAQGIRSTTTSAVQVAAGSPVRLLYGEKTLVTVTAEDSKAQNSEIRALATVWAKSINQAIQLPPLLIGTRSAELPPDKGSEIVLTGSAARQAALFISPKDVVKITRQTGKIGIQPLKVGSATLSVKVGNEVTEVTISILPYAAQLPQVLKAELTGVSPSLEIASATIKGAIQSQLACGNGAQIFVGNVPNCLLLPGGVKTVKVPVIVRAPGRFQTDGSVTVQVNNRGGSRQFENLLWYSNEPENLRETGDLYWGELKEATRVRLLWHHMNKTRTPMVVLYQVFNPSDQPARVSIVCGDAEPDLDPTKAGYAAGDRFFADWLQFNGQVVTIPPHSSVPIVLRSIRAEETTSGLASLSLLSGGSSRVIVTGEARWPLEIPNQWRLDSKKMWPWTRQRPMSLDDSVDLSGYVRHVYAPPYKSLDFAYRTGGHFQFIRVGEVGIPDAAQNGSILSGNFGVHYSIQGTMQNNSEKAEKVEVVFEASAGYAGALFVVNGKYVRGKVVSTKSTLMLHETTLVPGAVETLKIETLPLSGAHYPITITVRPKIAH